MTTKQPTSRHAPRASVRYGGDSRPIESAFSFRVSIVRIVLIRSAHSRLVIQPRTRFMKKEKSNRFASNIENKGRLFRPAGAGALGTTAIFLLAKIRRPRRLPRFGRRIPGLRSHPRLVCTPRLRGENKILSRFVYRAPIASEKASSSSAPVPVAWPRPFFLPPRE